MTKEKNRIDEDDLRYCAKEFMQENEPHSKRGISVPIPFRGELTTQELRHDKKGLLQAFIDFVLALRSFIRKDSIEQSDFDLEQSPSPTDLETSINSSHLEKSNNYKAIRDKQEKEDILRALEANKGIVTHAAEYLGIERTTLNSKIQKYSIDNDRIRRENKKMK